MCGVYDSGKLKATVSNSNQERDVFNFMTFCILLSTVTSRTKYRGRSTAIGVPLCCRVVTAAPRGMLPTTTLKTVKLTYEEQAGGDSRRPLYSARIRVCNRNIKMTTVYDKEESSYRKAINTEILFVSTDGQAWTACFQIPIKERVKGLLKPNENVFLVGRDLRRTETEKEIV